MADDKQDCIVAIKPCCDGIVYTAVNVRRVVDHEKIAELVEAGCRIEHWPVDAVRAATKWGCKCP